MHNCILPVTTLLGGGFLLVVGCSSDDATSAANAEPDAGPGLVATQDAGSSDATSASDTSSSTSEAGSDASDAATETLVGVRDTAFGTIGYRNTTAPARTILKAVPVPGRKEVYLYTLHSSAGILGRGVTRLSEDGVLDAAYGTAGLYETADSTLERSYRAFTVDSLGRAYFVGWPSGLITGGPSGPRGAQVVRLSATGSVDTTFGATGKYFNPTDTVGITLPRSEVRVALTLPNDDVLLGGYAEAVAGAATRQWIAFKVKATTGDVDTTFGDSGVARFALGTGDAPHLMHVATNGTVYLVGKRNASNATVVARFTAAGAHDSTYGGSGLATLGTGATFNIFDVATDGAGGLIAVGQAMAGNGKLQAVVTRLDTSGQVDTNFGTSGQVFVNYFETFAGADNLGDLATRVWFDGAGRILVGGFALDKGANGGPLAYSTVTRLTNGGAFDTSFEASLPTALAKVTNYGYASRFLADNVWDVGEIRPVFPSADGTHVYGVLLQAATNVHTFVRWR